MPVTLTMDEEIKKFAEQKAKKENRSLSNFVETLILKAKEEESKRAER